VERPKVEPAPMLRLFSIIGNVDMLEAMKGLGATHEEIGRRLGLSRPQTTNILNGQFRPSRDVVRRVLELAKAA
jgi:transcriptional regulator with XRE-family HTH domain